MDGAVEIIMLILQRADAYANAIERPKLPRDVLNEVQRKYMRYAISRTYHREWGKRLVQLEKAYKDEPEQAFFISMAKEAFNSAEQVGVATDQDVAEVDAPGLETLVQEALLDAEEYRWQKIKDGRLDVHIAAISARLETSHAEAKDENGKARRECALLSRTLGYIYQQLGRRERADEYYTKAVEFGYSAYFVLSTNRLHT